MKTCQAMFVFPAPGFFVSEEEQTAFLSGLKQAKLKVICMES